MWERSGKIFVSVIKIASRNKSTSWALADQLIVSGANFLTGLLVARFLGVSQFGQFNLAWLTVLFVQSIQNSIIHAPMMSIGSKQPSDERATYFTIVFFHQLSFAFLSTGVVVVSLRECNQLFPEWGLGPLIWPLSSALVAIQIQEFLRRYYFTIQRPRVSFASDAVRYGGQVGVLLWVFIVSSWRLEVDGVLWTILFTSCLGTLVALIRIDNLQWPKVGWKEVSLRHWNFSKWLIGSTILTWASGNIYYLVTGGLVGASAVGVLKSAQNIMAVAHVFFFGLQNVLPVRASEAYAKGGAVQLSKFLGKVSFLIVIPTCVIAMAVCVSPNRLMELLYGPDFREYGWVLVGYAFIYVLAACALVIPIGLLAIEKTSAILLSYACSGVIATILVYPLVRRYELAGVLAGLTIYHGIQILVPYLAFRRFLLLHQQDTRF
jgi:O-antigen/teichoic acid export membrane protein